MEGNAPWTLHPCQKQPSTKTVTLDAGNVKSGLPGRAKCLLQPVTRYCRKIATRRTSVAMLPLLLTLAIIADRFGLEKTSGIGVYQTRGLASRYFAAWGIPQKPRKSQ